MKFEAPIVDVKKFDLVDVLTASSAEEATTTTSEEMEMVLVWPCA